MSGCMSDYCLSLPAHAEQFSYVVSIYWYQGGGISYSSLLNHSCMLCKSLAASVPCLVPSRLNDTSSPWTAFFIFLWSQKEQFNSWSSILIHFWQAFPWMLFKDTCGFLQPINHRVWRGISMISVKPYKNVHEHSLTPHTVTLLWTWILVQLSLETFQ